MTSTAVEPLEISPTKSETTQKSSDNGTKMVSLLKEVYRMHKEVVRSSSNIWKDKFVKMRKIKNKISESKKSLEKKIAALEEKNKSLKEAQKSYSKLNGTCKNCQYLQLTLTTLRNSIKKSFGDKPELIQHLDDLPTAACRDQSIDNSSTKQHLDCGKHSRLKLESLQKKVVSSQAECDKFLQAANCNSGNQEYGKKFLLDSNGRTFGKKTVEKVSFSPEETVCPESFLFSNCSYESDCDSTDNKNKDLYSNSVKNTENDHLCQTNLEEDGLELSPKQEITRPVSLAFTSNKKRVSSKTPDMSPTLIASPIIDGPKAIEENQTEADLATNSPKRKKRITVRNASPFLVASQNALKVNTSKNQSCRLTKERRKQKIYMKENCLPNPFSPVDPDKTVPPEHWNTTTVMHPSEVKDDLTKDPSEHGGVKNQSRNNGISVVKELVPDSLRNCSLAPSMCMTEFLLESEEPTNNKPEEIVPKKVGPTETRHIEEPLIIVPSDSYKFVDGKPEDVLIRDKNPVSEKSNTQDNNCSITDSFDRCPWKNKEDYPYAYDAVVLKKHDRRLLNGYACQECLEYYKAKGLSDEEISKQIGDCSKHRAKYKPPNTPEHFWSIGFPDTEECKERGYFTTESKPSKGKNHKKGTEVTEKNGEYRMTQLLNYLDWSGSEEDD